MQQALGARLLPHPQAQHPPRRRPRSVRSSQPPVGLLAVPCSSGCLALSCEFRRVPSLLHPSRSFSPLFLSARLASFPSPSLLLVFSLGVCSPSLAWRHRSTRGKDSAEQEDLHRRSRALPCLIKGVGVQVIGAARLRAGRRHAGGAGSERGRRVGQAHATKPRSARTCAAASWLACVCGGMRTLALLPAIAGRCWCARGVCCFVLSGSDGTPKPSAVDTRAGLRCCGA